MKFSIHYTTVIISLSLLLLYSCKKSENKPAAPPVVPTHVSPPGIPVILTNCSGVMLSRMLTYEDRDHGSKTTIERTEQEAWAYFPDKSKAGVYLPAGNIYLNHKLLQPASGELFYPNIYPDNVYYIGANVGVPFVGIDTLIDWHMDKAGSIPPIGCRDTSDFAPYKGAFPLQVSKTEGFQMQFDSTTVPGADSVYLTISLKDKTYTSPNYDAQKGIISITPAILQPFATVDGKTSYAQVSIHSFSYRQKKFGYQSFAFVEEGVFVFYVTISQ